MEFYEILQGILDERGLNVSEAARMCGLPDGTVRSIFVRKQKNVALEVAFKLSAGLGVSLERLNGLPEKDAAKPTPEERLLALFRQLNDEGQEKLIDSADDLVESGKYIKSPAARMGREA